MYISGKVTGMPIEQAREVFAAAEIYLNNRAHTVINPLKLDHRPDGDWIDYMATDIEALLRGAEGIFMLDGWGESRGARIEYAIAKELGLHVIFQSCNSAISKAEPKRVIAAKECYRCGRPFVSFITDVYCDQCATGGQPANL